MPKPRTSSAVKRRYNAKTYTRVTVELRKELVAEWEAKLAEDGMSKAEFIRQAMQGYLGINTDTE